MWVRGPRRGGLIDKLVELAHGDVDLVQRAIRESSGRMHTAADLEKIVRYIQDYNNSSDALSKRAKDAA